MKTTGVVVVGGIACLGRARWTRKHGVPFSVFMVQTSWRAEYAKGVYSSSEMHSLSAMYTRTRKVEEYVHAKRPELHIILVLNKIDLVPEHVTAAWVRVSGSEAVVHRFSLNKVMFSVGEGK